MKEYKKPISIEIEITGQTIIATSNLRYTNESADRNSEVLSGKSRGEWGDVWKQ